MRDRKVNRCQTKWEKPVQVGCRRMDAADSRIELDGEVEEYMAIEETPRAYKHVDRTVCIAWGVVQWLIKDTLSEQGRRHLSKTRGKLVSYLIWDVDCEIWMIKCFPHSDALWWIECKKSLDEVQELPINDICWWNDILETTSSSYIFFALTRSFCLGPVQSAAFLEELGLSTTSSTSKAVWHLAHDHLHHGEMF